MGRKLYRVPLDFDWPLKQKWPGFLNPFHPTICACCEGTGEKGGEACRWCDKGDIFVSPLHMKLFDEWERTDPPEGPGFQLWETTSDGSPISPVFTSLDELCKWAETNATTFGSHRTTAAEWKRMLEADFVVHQEGNILFL